MTSRLNYSKLSTAALADDQSFHAFRSALGATHDAFRLVDDESRFEADLEAWRIEDLVLTAGFQSGCRMERDLDRIGSDGYDHVTLMMIRQGHGQGDADGPISWGSGEILVLDARKPMAVSTSDNTNIGVRLPRAHLHTRLAQRRDLHGLVLRDAGALILGDHFASLVRHAPMLTPTDVGLVVRSTVAIIASVLDDAPAVALRKAEASDLRDRARAYAAACPDPRLTPEALARGIGVSRSSLYRAFGGGGGVSRYLRDQRLNVFRDALRDSAERRGIAQIAYALGFGNVSAATAAYSRRFGKTPSQEKRDRDADRPLTDPATLGHAYRVWLDRLQALPTAPELVGD